LTEDVAQLAHLDPFGPVGDSGHIRDANVLRSGTQRSTAALPPAGGSLGLGERHTAGLHLCAELRVWKSKSDIASLVESFAPRIRRRVPGR
jgi:hypothetical protein